MTLPLHQQLIDGTFDKNTPPYNISVPAASLDAYKKANHWKDFDAKG